MGDSESDASTEALHVVLEVEDHESLLDLMGVLDDADLPVRTETIARANLEAATTTEIDLDVLTDKQRRTLTLALEEGYYDRPRDATLADLADHLDVSKSAVSQRIRMAEIKLVKTAFTRGA